MAQKRSKTKQLTVSAQGVFSEGVRQSSPDPHQVAQVLATPEPISLWVRHQEIIESLRKVIQNSSSQASLDTIGGSRPKKKTKGAHLSLFAIEEAENQKSVVPIDNTDMQSESEVGQGSGLEEDELLWGENETSNTALVERFKTRFYPVAGGVGFYAGEVPFFLPLSARELAFITARLTARNAALGLLTPESLAALAQHHAQGNPVAVVIGADVTTSGTIQKTTESDEPQQNALQPVVREAVRYFLHTGQEIDILERSAADGKRGENWKSEEMVGKRIYQTSGSSHRVELRENDEIATHQEREDLNLATLEQLTLSQDSDFAFAMLYITAALAPPAPLPVNAAALGWIDLDDVMEKIGWYPGELSAADREAKRARLWDYVCYGNRAIVVGQRTSSYRDPITGEEISTRIESPIWRILSTERPVQQGLRGDVPRRAQLVISKEWEPMLVSARLAQYLPLAEIVGQIPPQKVAGDWARTVALVLARLWRMKPQAFLAGELRPTRRELLTHYTPKTKTADELLSSSNPKRAMTYWHDALSILCEVGFLAPKGEAIRTVNEMRAAHTAYRWQQAWLDEAIELHPGQTLLISLQERAASSPVAPPKPMGKKRGRPRKKRAE